MQADVIQRCLRRRWDWLGYQTFSQNQATASTWYWVVGPPSRKTRWMRNTEVKLTATPEGKIRQQSQAVRFLSRSTDQPGLIQYCTHTHTLHTHTQAQTRAHARARTRAHTHTQWHTHIHNHAVFCVKYTEKCAPTCTLYDEMCITWKLCNPSNRQAQSANWIQVDTNGSYILVDTARLCQWFDTDLLCAGAPQVVPLALTHYV